MLLKQAPETVLAINQWAVAAPTLHGSSKFYSSQKLPSKGSSLRCYQFVDVFLDGRLSLIQKIVTTQQLVKIKVNCSALSPLEYVRSRQRAYECQCPFLDVELEYFKDS